MRKVVARSTAVLLVAAATATINGQSAPPAQDVYHVHFAKAMPGESAALGAQLATPDKTAAMPDHFVVLRHQEGDDWDYVAIQHVGKQATIGAAPPGATPRAITAWHSDTFVAGPSWAEFAKAMGIGAGNAANMVYTVGVQRAVAGHHEQLQKSLSAPAPAGSNIQSGNVLFHHIEGGEWTFLTITRHNSWQDFGADHAAAIGAADGGWDEVRQHSAFHRDTIADRVAPK
jgi:hypothetical protein